MRITGKSGSLINSGSSAPRKHVFSAYGVIGNHPGMTLIELLIVMALLAGLATYALISMGDMSARARYDVTRARVERVREALRGDGQHAGRFVSDMGRLPQAGELCELWSNKVNYNFQRTAYTNLMSAPYAQIEGGLYCGWAGPYLIGEGTNYYDGFGEPMTYDGVNLTAHTEGMATWLTANLSESFADLTNAILQVRVLALRNNPWESRAVWANAELWSNNAGLTQFNPPGLGNTNEMHALYACSNHVYVCCQSNNDDCADANSPNWRLMTRHNYFTAAAVVLTVPDMAATGVLQCTSNCLANTSNGVVFDGLAPGMRQVFAYGYNRDDAGALTANGWWSGIQDVEILPGANHLDLYLTEPLK